MGFIAAIYVKCDDCGESYEIATDEDIESKESTFDLIVFKRYAREANYHNVDGRWLCNSCKAYHDEVQAEAEANQ